MCRLIWSDNDLALLPTVPGVELDVEVLNFCTLYFYLNPDVLYSEMTMVSGPHGLIDGSKSNQSDFTEALAFRQTTISACFR